MTSTRASSSNAERALDILLFLGRCDDEGASLSRITAEIGESKPATHRSLQALCVKGFAEPAARHGYYRLGPAIDLLARAQNRRQPSLDRIRPGMTEFTRRTGYTTYLMIRSGLDSVCAEIISRFDNRRTSMMGVGARLPMGIAAGSLALLSIQPEDEMEQILHANAKRYEAYPSLRPVNAALIREQALLARAKGYAVNHGFFFLGEGGLGLPVRAAGSGDVDMAVSFNLPVEYMGEESVQELIEQLRDCLSKTL